MSNTASNKLLSSTAYRKLRARKLLIDALCEECLRHDIIEPAAEVDHIIPRSDRPDLAMSIRNLQSLCTPCHQIKTQRENTRHLKEYAVVNAKYDLTAQGGEKRI